MCVCVTIVVHYTDAHEEVDATRHFFLAPMSGNDQGGAVDLRVNLMWCSQVEINMLVMNRFPFIETQRQLPSGGVVTRGMLDHTTRTTTLRTEFSISGA